MAEKLTRREALRRIAGAAVSLPAAGALPAGSRPAGAPPPNILLISIDTLRADHVSALGYARPTTPALDALARSGVLFRRAFSPSSWTAPAHASVFTGVYPTTHQVEGPQNRLAPSWPTVARQLKALGYTTQAVVSGPMVDRRFGFEMGFDHFDDASYVQSTDLRGVVDNNARDEILLYGVRAADTIAGAALKWLAAKPPEPWFLFLHFWDIHADYKPPAPYDKQFDPDYAGRIDGTIKSEAVSEKMPERDLRHLIALYDGEIAWTDSQIGRVIQGLDAHGLRGKTCVAAFSDHGEEFFEHGTKGHAHNLSDLLIRVPVVFSWPGRIPAGGEIQRQIGLVDLAPTLVDLAGGQAPEWTQGRSLRPYLLGGALPEERPVYGSLFFRGRSLLYAQAYPMKLINDPYKKALEFYDLSKDPQERVNLYQSDPARGMDAFRQLETWWGECEKARRRAIGPESAPSSQPGATPANPDVYK